jgi:hypothetical protein
MTDEPEWTPEQERETAVPVDFVATGLIGAGSRSIGEDVRPARCAGGDANRLGVVAHIAQSVHSRPTRKELPLIFLIVFRA